ncbi:MAG: hypothetical protein ACI3XM_01835 [Eubacteriales bacterium]
MESKKTMKRSSYMLPAESRAVWKKLRGLAENGDMKAIKLYYDILAKKEQGSASAAAAASGEGVSGGKREPDMMPLAAIRRAVFGDSAMQKDYLRVLEAEKNGTEEAGGADAADDTAVTEVTEEDREEDTETVREAEISDNEYDSEWESGGNGEADA